MTDRLELREITKQYPAVLANDRVSLRVSPGEIHAVLGENGAGKSTLMKIIYGAVRPDGGDILVDGKLTAIRSPQQARALGIAMVFQHFSLFETLTVAENVMLGLPAGVTLADTSRRIREKAAEYGQEIDPDRPVHTLSVGERQRVEIVRALLLDPRLLILDEPTSVLTPQAVEKLFVTLRRLAATGCAILYISHKLDEIRALCHRCTVLRGGRVTGEVDPARESNASLSRLMIGEDPKALQLPPARLGEVALEVRELSLPRADRFGTDLQRIGFALRAGEVLGVAGISGNGQQELLAALSGEDRRAAPQAIRLFGEPVGDAAPRARRDKGLHVVPEERLGRGAVPSLSLAANTLLTRREPVGASGWLHLNRAAQLAAQLIATFGVKAGGPQSPARSLSGGNLQKFIVGREIDARPRVLIVAQPTWGVDVGATSQIRSALLKLREAGCAVLVISEDLEELFELCDRMMVIARGRLSPSLDRDQASVERIGAWMSGLWEDEPAEVAR